MLFGSLLVGNYLHISKKLHIIRGCLRKHPIMEYRSWIAVWQVIWETKSSYAT